MTATYIGGNNTYIPDFQSSGKLTIDFARNPEKFRVLRYAALQKVEKRVGLYLKQDLDEQIRTTADGAEWLWVDGDNAPDNYVEKSFEWLPYATKRFTFPFSLGQIATDQAAWDVVASHAATVASIAMTLRTRKVIAAMTDAAQMTQTDSATSLGGGKWNSGTSAAPYIKLGLMKAVNQILQNTNAVVEPSSLSLIINPETAVKMAASSEIHEYMKGSPFSLPLITDNLQEFGLPNKLYGINVIVEQTPFVSSGKKGARVAGWAFPDDTAVLVARPGEIVQVGGSFSTVSLLMAEELTVETRYEQDNRRTIGRVVEDYDVRITAPVSGYLITDVIS